MQIRPRAYPHPVLSPFSDDIPDASFQPTIVVKGTSASYALDATFKISDPTLKELIASKEAQFAVHVECQSTRYRTLHKSYDEKFEFRIPANVIDGPVDVCSFVLAAKDLHGYKNPGVHKDYGGSAFEVRKGDTLAVGPDFTFDAEKNIDPLRRIPSIFVIVPDEAEGAAPLDIDASGDKVRILLSKKNFDLYKVLRQSQPLLPVLCSMIIVPALVALLEEVRQAMEGGGTAELEEKRWYRVVAKKLKPLGIDPAVSTSFSDSSVLVAQRLIGGPLEESLAALNQYEETEE